MAKGKNKEKELPLVKGDLNLDEAELKKLKAMQDEFQTRFKERLEASKKEALERYSIKIESLTKAKEEMLKGYNDEIKKYKALVKELGGTVERAQPKAKSSKKPK